MKLSFSNIWIMEHNKKYHLSYSEKCVVSQFTIAAVFYTKNVVFSANPESLSLTGSATYQTTGNECQYLPLFFLKNVLSTKTLKTTSAGNLMGPT